MLKEIVQEVQEIHEGKHDSDADRAFMNINKVAVDLHHKIKKAKGAEKKALEKELDALGPLLMAMKQKTTQW